jgi:MFS family permease
VLLVAAVWLPTPSFAGFLAGGVLTGVSAGLAFKGAVAAAELAPDDRRAEVLAGLFLAGYIGLAGPVVGLGLLTLFAPPQVGLLVFAGVLAAAVVAVAPGLLRRPSVRVPAPGPEHVKVRRGGAREREMRGAG